MNLDMLGFDCLDAYLRRPLPPAELKALSREEKRGLVAYSAQ